MGNDAICRAHFSGPAIFYCFALLGKNQRFTARAVKLTGYTKFLIAIPCLVFVSKVWHSTHMGNKDSRGREKKKPKKKPQTVVQAPPPLVRAPAPKA